MPHHPNGSRRRVSVASGVIGALVLLTAFIGPASAAPPHRVIFKLDGLAASATFVEWQRVGDLDHALVTTLHYGMQRTNNRAEPPARQEIVSVDVTTYWLPADRASDDEVLAVMAEGGHVSTEGRIAIDRKDLAYATLASTDVVLDRLYCSSQDGWERLCDEAPSQRAVTVRAELTAVGELEGDRYTSHDEILACRFLEVGSHVSRDADGTVWVGDTPHTAFIPWLTYITDGTTFLRALCRI